MGVAAELLSHTVPLATGEIMGVNPAYFLAAAGLATAGYNVKKITPGLHTTINKGELGVVLRRGEPVERRLTQAKVEAGESNYKIKGPGWYFVAPFSTIQPVYVTDQFDKVHFPLDSDDGPQVAVQANVTWNVSPDGDNPVRSITAVMHQKLDKKEDTNNTEAEVNRRVLENRVLGICGVALGQTLTGLKAKTLKTLNKDAPEEVQQETIERSRERLLKYGVVLSAVELMPIARVGEEVLAQALLTHSPNQHLLGVAALLGQTANDGESAEHGNGNGHHKVVSLRSGEPV